MQITYELEEKDIIAFFDYSMKKNSTFKNVNIFNYLFIFAVSYWQLLYAVLFNDFLYNFNWTQFIFYIVVGTITFGFALTLSKTIAYFIGQYIKNSTAKKHTRGDGVLGEHTIEIKENFLIETTDVNQTQHSWKGVDRIEENENYIFIYISPVNAHIIPKKCFFDPTNAVLFFEEAKRLKESAKTNFSPSYLASNS